jgi:DNA adenine methylase
MKKCLDKGKNGVEPFLKWAGGKRWLAPNLAPFLVDELNKTQGTYFEPFLGAGAMFFAMSPENAVLSDINEGLIDVYKQVKHNWLAISNQLQSWPVNKKYYYSVRSTIPRSALSRACRFLYLNRTCYGGLYRENQSGKFNVPYGGGDRKPNTLWENNLLQRASFVLGDKIKLIASDFENIIASAGDGDVVYCDPTYSTQKRKQFDRYGKTVFDWTDQMRLAIAAEKAMDRGALVVISNSGCFHLAEFYPRAYRIELQRSKTIGNKASCNSVHQESLYILDPKSRRKKWAQLGKITNRKSSVSITPTITLKNEVNTTHISIDGS